MQALAALWAGRDAGQQEALHPPRSRALEAHRSPPDHWRADLPGSSRPGKSAKRAGYGVTLRRHLTIDRTQASRMMNAERGTGGDGPWPRM